MEEENPDNNRTEGGSPPQEPTENTRKIRAGKRSVVSPDKLAKGGPWKQEGVRTEKGNVVSPDKMAPGVSPSGVFRGYISEDARYEWSRACNYHRGTDLGHVCGNPEACSRRIAKAEMLEMFQRDLAREWS